jgi:hypothetical protein
MRQKEQVRVKLEAEKVKLMRNIYNRYKYYQEHHPFGMRRFKHKHHQFKTKDDWQMFLSINKAA